MALSGMEIHLVIMDVMMPELGGLSATFNIRKDENILVIIISAKSEDTDKITGLNFGAFFSASTMV